MGNVPPQSVWIRLHKSYFKISWSVLNKDISYDHVVNALILSLPKWSVANLNICA